MRLRTENPKPLSFLRFYFESFLLLPRLIDAGNSIQTARIPEIRQALRHNAHEKIAVVPKIDIPLRMGNELRLAPTLRHQKRKGDHFALLKIKACAGIISPKQFSASQRLIWLFCHAVRMPSPKISACTAMPFSNRFSIVVVACEGSGCAIV